jgi:hypothetical protein
MKAHITSRSTVEVKKLTLITDDGQEYHLEPTRSGFKVRGNRPLFVQWIDPCEGEVLMVGKGYRAEVSARADKSEVTGDILSPL